VYGKKSGYASLFCDGPYITRHIGQLIVTERKIDKAKLIMQFGGCCFVFSTSSLIKLHQINHIDIFVDLEQI
jgi:hypothetical protein